MSSVAFIPTSTSLADAPIVTKLPDDFIDRRATGVAGKGSERRQFGNSHRDLSSPGKELAEAIDAYKVNHRRRYITTDEMLEVILALGYKK